MEYLVRRREAPAAKVPKVAGLRAPPGGSAKAGRAGGSKRSTPAAGGEDWEEELADLGELL